jgi:hypothetical protein
MNRPGKYLSFCLVVILAVSTLLLPLANAQSTPKPAIPEFRLVFVDKSFTTTDGVYYDSKTIQVTIANQPSLNSSLFYNVRYRINSGSWIDIYTMDDAYPTQSDSKYTIISVYLHPQGNATLVPTNSIVEVQAEAMIGYIHRVFNPNHTSQLDMYPYVFTGETSGWSSIQTITIPVNSDMTPTESLPNDGPTSPPNSNSDLTMTLTWIMIGVLVISVISLLLYIKYLKKTTKNSTSHSTTNV